MAFASGPGKVLTINEEVTFGTLVAAGGISLERVESTVDLTKDVYGSNAIRTTQQIKVSRHGMRKVGGTIKAELNPGALPRVMQGHLRKDFATGATTGAVVTISTTNTTFHRSSGSFLTNGFKVGCVVAATGFTSGAASVNNQRLLVTAATATDLTLLNLDGTTPALGTNAAGDTVTLAEVGKTTYFPQSGHTDKSFDIEHWYSDIAQSEAFVGCKFNKMSVDLPTTGLATVQFDVLGRNISTSTSQQLTSPTSATSGNGLASVNGVLLLHGTGGLAYINALNFNTDCQQAVDGVIGSNLTPFVWQGVMKGAGQITAFFQDATFRDYFVNETEVGLTILLTAATGTSADFMRFTFPRTKIDGATKDDKQTGGIKLTGNLTFLENTAGGAGTSSEATTIVVQDSLA
jgi:hypothetical protein